MNWSGLLGCWCGEHDRWFRGTQGVNIVVLDETRYEIRQIHFQYLGIGFPTVFDRPGQNSWATKFLESA